MVRIHTSYPALILLGILTVSSPLHADEEGKSFQVYANPLGALLGIFDVGADIRVGDQLTLGPAYYSISYTGTRPLSSSLFSYSTQYSAKGFGARASWQFGESKTISGGWVLSAFAQGVGEWRLHHLIFPPRRRSQNSLLSLCPRFRCRRAGRESPLS